MRSKIFNTDQVHAIQEGRMTQFMQAVKPEYQPVRYEYINGKWMMKQAGWPLLQRDEFISRFCPFGKVGDVIAVRETFQYYGNAKGQIDYLYKAKAGDEERLNEFHDPIWRPSAAMPREAARLFLRITNIRVMRVQELTEEDAKAQIAPYQNDRESYNGEHYHGSHKNGLKSLVGIKAWDENQFHWIIDLTKTDKP
jgi:hypothetical protein